MNQTIKISLLTALFATIVTAQSQAAEWTGASLNGLRCTGNSQGFGPFDYFDVNEASDPMYRKGRFWEIDRIHTDRALRLMQRGKYIGQGDFQLASNNIDYTLRAIPNEPKALQAVVELARIESESVKGVRNPNPPPECYFQRAIAFRSNQPHLHILYGIYLQRLGHMDDAAKLYRTAVEVDGKSAEAHYNLGLVLVRLEEWDEAAEHARIAYNLGYPLQGLRRKLERQGVFLMANDEIE